MTKTATDFASKLAVAFVAVAMVVAAFAPAAQAQSSEDLQQMINDLLAQVAQLQGGAAPSASADVCPYTWTRSLTTGSEGTDVMKLQEFLNANADTRVAATGAGSVGAETMYYGPATAAAVSKFQVMYRAEVLSPAGLVNPTGYFGPSTMAKANSLCLTAAIAEEVEEEMEEEMEEAESTELEGEGELVTFEIDDEEDTVTEGDEDVAVMALTLEAEDGDVEVSRLGFSMVGTGTNEEEDAYDVFTEYSLWVDGDKIASIEADDEDEYLDEDDGTFRFTNLGLILREDDEVEVIVAVSVMNSVDGSDADLSEWTLEANSVRYFDADGVATTEDDTDEMPASVVFDIEEEGTDDGADIEGSSDTPDSTTLLVDEDTDDSDEYVLHIFDIEVDNDSGDLEVNDVYATTTITNDTGSDVTGGQEDVIDGIFMTIDGETVEGEATTDGDLESANIADGSSTEVVYLFEFDGDVVLEGDEDYAVEISAVFKGQDSNYTNGLVVTTSVDGTDWEVEGSADDNTLDGTDSSEDHTLSTVVPVISDTSFDVDRNEDGDAGVISFEFTVEADGEEDVDLTFVDVTDIDGASDDVRFTISGGDLGANATASIAKISGDATLVGNVWTINDGDEATFVVDVAFDAASATGAYRVYMDTIGGVEIDETSSALNI
jgi:hypothetical protein